MREFKVIEYPNRYEIYFDTELVAYAKHNGYEDLVHAHHFHGGYESPCKLFDFITQALRAWVRKSDPVIKHRKLEKSYIELLDDPELSRVELLNMLMELPCCERIEWIKKNPECALRLMSR